MKLIFLGPPGAGKGTQAGAVANALAIKHISTGDMFREAIRNKTRTGLMANEYIVKGLLVPDEVVIQMVQERLDNDDCANGYLLDGFPRTLAQAEALDAILAKRGESVTAVVSIMIPDELIYKRIEGRALIEGRADDADRSIIKHRIDTYHSQTEPLIAFYKEQGKYYEVDVTGETIEENRQRVLKLMETIE